ncbi:CCR4-NOT transcription complex subunit 10, partial [Xenoophorus captivus]
GSEQESKSLPCKKGIVQSVIGTGYHRKIVLASQSSQNTNYRSVRHPEAASCNSEPQM